MSEDEVKSFVRRSFEFAKTKRDVQTQAELAAAFGVHYDTVRRMVYGRWSPAQRMLATVLVEFCQALHRANGTE